MWLFDLWKFFLHDRSVAKSKENFFLSDTEISERCQKCLAEKINACAQIQKVTLTVHCECAYCAFRNLGVSNKCPSGSWCIIFWKEPHVDVCCMGTVTKEGVKNLYPRKTPKLSVYGSVCGDQQIEVVGLNDVGMGLKLVVWKRELQLTAQRLNSLTKSRQKSWEFSSLLFTVSSTALPWDFYFFKLTQPLRVSVKDALL